MQIFSVGRTLISDDEIRWIPSGNFAWMVYDYDGDGYEGYGHLVALNKNDGLFYVMNLAHCSCDGLINDWKAQFTKEELFHKSTSCLDEDIEDSILDKIRELLCESL